MMMCMSSYERGDVIVVIKLISYQENIELRYDYFSLSISKKNTDLSVKTGIHIELRSEHKFFNTCPFWMISLSYVFSSSL